MDSKGDMPVTASNGSIKRWLESGAVLINGKRPKPKDVIELPVWQLIFFPKGKKRTTFHDEDNPNEVDEIIAPELTVLVECAVIKTPTPWWRILLRKLFKRS